MTVLTVQIKSIKQGWVDQTIVTIMHDVDGNETAQQVEQLKSELPVGFAARIKIVTNGIVSYTW